ncbi:MAG: iron chaperone, partial [Actinomycetota bacterium]
LSQHDAVKQKTVKKIFRTIQKKYPKLELVIAWNQPMLKLDKDYLFGVSVLKNHILVAPFNAKVLQEMKKDLTDYKVNKKTVQVPVDWKVDEKLLLKMISLNLKAIKK